MINLAEMRSTAKTYRADKAHIGVIGSHSALAMGMAAKAFGAKTLLVVEKGRDALYAREHQHLYDHIITLEKFKDILKPDVQAELLSYNTVWIPHRSFTVYVGVDGIENEFKIPDVRQPQNAADGRPECREKPVLLSGKGRHQVSQTV